MKILFALISIFSILFDTTNLLAADKYSVGDQLFIWAQSGLNMRETPSTKAKIIAQIRFGESISVIEKRTETYHLNGISGMNPYSQKEIVDPIIFKGHWVRVRNQAGISGYVIDQYLLRYEPYEKQKVELHELNLAILHTDTLDHEYWPSGDVRCENLKYSYQEDIEAIVKSCNRIGYLSYQIPNCSIEEALILFSRSFDDYQYAAVSRNWKDEVRIYGDLFSLTIKKDSDGVTVAYEVTC